MSLVKKILESKKTFVFFHTYSVNENVLVRAVKEGRSMDLDICVDDVGDPYLGHSQEFYEKSGEARPLNMPLRAALEILEISNIPVIVDCKHINAWPVIEETVSRIGAPRCLVHAFAQELKFDYSRLPGEPDYLTEWQPLEKLRSFKEKFPEATTCASCKWLPEDLLLGNIYQDLTASIRDKLKQNSIDTVCLNIPNNTFNDDVLNFFLRENIICHIGIDGIDTFKLKEIYIGETDDLARASNIL